ncbi:DUF2029 domain-containing protein [Subsaximicrobium wynnwilliamsii]|uniref:DUF2029 domain-containing protein n=1 Tax=Subsaximicrobium wynnwilliamsii TaxID=291179 RepID=A0A5C6ZJ28_9FLAO|nr:glycosyltransferase 87 family protein [Subsaximicrobium wynnwilliamsii]TXD83535.1 DUF2029 domain-containing protein [Subsaximicrobium wynnwilliamsii]TXD89190.1 DUF2029 domain-containing protein [Subsaximicrobium wynnwilliamsii]TXE03215.1 DUF2029 domain-containing protein [Subsaximicrobium wynnwilliamsii]
MFKYDTLKLYKFPILIALSSMAFYFSFAYDLERSNHTKLLTLYVGLWVAFYFLLKFAKHNLKLLTLLAFLFRALFILAIPNLSQDFYRFIWDGRMILAGINPYLFTPESVMNASNLPIAEAQQLYDGMGQLSATHFSNYPPLNQLCFSIAALFAGHSILGSVVVLRLLIIAADFGTLYFGRKLLRKLKLPEHHIFWYILNPFIIIELSGNLHFEGLMVFFLIWSLYLLHAGKWRWAAVLFACSISVKLIPLLFLPLFYGYFRKPEKRAQLENQVDKTIPVLKIRAISLKKLIAFYGSVGAVTLLLFSPFFSWEFVHNYSETVALWFNNFEFNASLYYLARQLGFWLSGYNEIAVIGKIFAVLVFLSVMSLAALRSRKDTKVLIGQMLFAFAIFLFFSTTVHPWYLATLLLLSVFTTYKFPLIWSAVVMLSYFAYSTGSESGSSENLLIIAIEYIVVFGVLIWELFFKRVKEGFK